MSRWHPISETVIDEMVRLFEELKYVPSVAARLKLPNQSVWYWLKRRGTIQKGKKYCLSRCRANHQTVLDMLKDGANLRKIARAVGTTHSRVKEYLIKNNLPVPRRFSYAGRNNPRWRGGRLIDKNGYILLHAPDHPYANCTGYVREHRIVMEKQIGRALLPDEVVHHKDGDKANNQPENLELFSCNGDHLKHELTGKCPKWTPDGIRRIRAGHPRSRETMKARNLAKKKQGVPG